MMVCHGPLLQWDRESTQEVPLLQKPVHLVAIKVPHKHSHVQGDAMCHLTLLAAPRQPM